MFKRIALLKAVRKVFLRLCPGCKDSLCWLSAILPSTHFSGLLVSPARKHPAQTFTAKAAGKCFCPAFPLGKTVLLTCKGLQLLSFAIHLLSYATLGLSKSVAWASSLRYPAKKKWVHAVGERMNLLKKKPSVTRNLGINASVRRNHTSGLWKQNQYI